MVTGWRFALTLATLLALWAPRAAWAGFERRKQHAVIDARLAFHAASYVADAPKVVELIAEASERAAEAAARGVDLAAEDIELSTAVGVRDGDGRHALMVCGVDPQTSDGARVDARCGEIARAMLGAGLAPNTRDARGWSAAGYAAALGHASVLRALAAHGGALDSPAWGDAHGRPPLTLAVINGRLRAVRAPRSRSPSISAREGMASHRRPRPPM